MVKNQILNQQFTLNCNGRLLSISKPIVMGIINATPDSFYAGSRLTDEKVYLNIAEKMLSDGAVILDIGGQSTRPNATLISQEEELQRVIPVIKNISTRFPEAIISVDTFYGEVANAAVDSGASMINDISNGSMDNKLLPMVSKLKVPYILMHSKGTPQNMQQLSSYENITQEVFQFFIYKIEQLKALSIHDVIIDAGYGFAKTIEQNFELLNQSEKLIILQKPILAGLSRKSMIWKSLQTTPEEALNGTTALNMIALEKGAKILRVHDVKEAVEAIQLHQLLSGQRA